MRPTTEVTVKSPNAAMIKSHASSMKSCGQNVRPKM